MHLPSVRAKAGNCHILPIASPYAEQKYNEEYTNAQTDLH